MKKYKKIKTKILVISDIHLGSRVSRSKKLQETLEKYSFRKLIILGDLFEDINIGDLTSDDWRLVSYIHNLSKKTKIVWVEGNHDKGLIKIFSNLLDVKSSKTYKWRHHGETFLAIHGHQFDRFLVNNIVLSHIASWAYLFIQKIDFSDYRISRFVKKQSKGWLRLSKKVAVSAILHGRLRGVDYVFCGHTHRENKRSRKDIAYFNSGCWTDIPSAFITIDDEIKIHKVW